MPPTTPFEEHGRGTRLVATTVFASQANRDGMGAVRHGARLCHHV